MSQPLISVIVPIYNVEKYVRKCLDSLKNQTMKQIEVICIDDGSTDGSGKIADEYVSEEFPIFRVIHTENRGLSAARNRGIDEARADWLMLVDSDDWVDVEFCRVPYEAAMKYDADLVIFRSLYVDHGRVRRSKQIDAPVGITDEMKAHEYGGFAVWNKVYKRLLFETIKFPEGHVCEDIATTHKLVRIAERVALLSDSLYFYVNREGSITHTKTAANKRDCFTFSLERCECLAGCGYSHAELLAFLSGPAIGFLVSTVPSKDELYIKAKSIVDEIKGIPYYLTLKQKVGLMAWKTNKRLFYLLGRVSGRVHR